MATYVQNKLTKVTIIVVISILALFIRPLRWKHAVHLLSAYDFFHNPDSNNLLLFFFMRGLCVVYVWLEQTSVNKTQWI